MGALSVRAIAKCHNIPTPISFKEDPFSLGLKGAASPEKQPVSISLRTQLTWLNKKCIADILGKWPFEGGTSLAKLMPKLITCNFNPEMCMSATTDTDGTSLMVEGRFYTKNDVGTLKWDSKQALSHPYFFTLPPNVSHKAPDKHDFKGLVLEFDYEIEGDLPYLYEEKFSPSLIITSTDGTEHEVRLWLYDTQRPIDDWEFAHRPFLLKKENLGVNIEAGDMDKPDENFEKEFARKWTWPDERRQPSYQTGNSGHIRLEFDKLHSGRAKFIVNPNKPDKAREQDEDYWVESNDWEKRKINPSAIESIQWQFRPKDYASINEPLPTSQWFRISFHNWRVTGPGFIQGLTPLLYHPVRLANNYDEVYRFTPQWLIEQYHALGFRDSINLFVGASRFYNRAIQFADGNLASVLSDGFRTWFTNYLQAAQSFNFTRVTVAISMENVGAPDTWVQKYEDGTLATHGAAKILSFCHPAVQSFYKRFIDEITALQHQAGLEISILLNQPQWWANGLADLDSPGRLRRPCFYDAETRNKHLHELGRPLPPITTTWQNPGADGPLLETVTWLQKQNGDFTLLLRDHLRKRWPNKDTNFSVLFSVPSVIDETFASPIMSRVNFPQEQWRNLNAANSLDGVGISDYVYLTKMAEARQHQDEAVYKAWQEKHTGIYTLIAETLGYPAERTCYFLGVALPPHSQLQGEINQALKDGLDHKLKPYMWATAQVFHDGWLPPKVLTE